METHADAEMPAPVDPPSRKPSRPASAPTVETPNAHATTANVAQAVQALERLLNHAALETPAHAAMVNLPANARTTALATRANALAALTDLPSKSLAIYILFVNFLTHCLHKHLLYSLYVTYRL